MPTQFAALSVYSQLVSVWRTNGQNAHLLLAVGSVHRLAEELAREGLTSGEEWKYRSVVAGFRGVACPCTTLLYRYIALRCSCFDGAFLGKRWEQSRGSPMNHLLPVPDAISAPYWAGCSEHILKLPRCSRCGEFTLPPDVTCPHCHSLDPEFTFEAVSGEGTVRTWTIIRQSFLTGFEVPFLLVDVQLKDQPRVRMVGRLLDGPEAPLRIGDAVAVAFEDIAPGVALPAFRMVAKA